MQRDEQGKFLKVYNVDETFFKFIEREDQAYVLGFLYADGCNQIINEKYKFISFT